MNKKSKKFLYDLLNTPSPSGFEKDIQVLIRDYIKPYAEHLEVDYHGNLIAGINTKAKKRLMLAGHCDQIGFIVKKIDKEGYIRVDNLGGIDYGVVPGSRVVVVGKKKKVNGVFGRKPIHWTDRGSRDKMPLGAKHNWIDIGAKSKKEAEKLVQIGDPVVYTPGVLELANNLISASGLDDRVGCYVAIETLKELSKENIDIAVYAVSTVQEEVGLRGAITSSHKIDPELGIAIDVTFANDNPANSAADNRDDVKLGDGPTVTRGLNTNSKVGERLESTAKKKKIPFQTELCTYPYGNDTSAIQINRDGVATADLGIPCRYMHTTAEVISLDDLDNAVKILVNFAKSVKKSTSFIPY